MAKPYPWYYLADGRPVKIVRHSNGDMDAFVLDPVTGGFQRDGSYLARVFEVGSGAHVGLLTEEQFDALVDPVWQKASDDRHAAVIAWTPTGDPEFPYRAEWNGRTFTLRANDFPVEPWYTVMAGDEEIEDLDHWPGKWIK